MTISFSEISPTNKVPASLTEVGSSGPAGQAAKRVVIIGYRLSTATVAADTPTPVYGATQADAQHGTGSQLAEMCRAYKNIDPTAQVDAVGISDTGGTAATGSIGLTGTATASGELAVLIGGRRYSVAVASGAAAASLLTSLKAAIDADTRRAVTTGTIAANAIPLTARNLGLPGNRIDVRRVSDSVAGLTPTITAMSGGAVAPTLTNAIANLSAKAYDSVVLGFSDATTLGVVASEMARRFAAGVEQDGIAYYAYTDTLANTLSAASSRNSRHLCAIAGSLSPTPPWVWAAQTAAQATRMFALDPGLPRIDLTLPDCIPADLADQFEPAERQQLLAAGVSTHYVSPDGVCLTERLVTEYKTDSLGVADETFSDECSMRIIADYRQKWKARTSKYRAFKLVDDDTPLKPGTRAVTAGYMAAEMDSFYEDYASTGNVENVAYFLANRRAERNASDRRRLDTYHPINLGNIVVTIASRLEFTL